MCEEKRGFLNLSAEYEMQNMKMRISRSPYLVPGEVVIST